MNEKMATALRWLKSHLDRVVVGFVVVMFLFQVMLYMKDRSVTPPERPTLPKTPLPELIDPVHEKLVSNTYGSVKDVTQSELVNNLIKFNMFDVKTVKKREDIDREITEKLGAAERLYNQNRKEDALKLIEEILILDRNVTKAGDMKTKILAELPTPTPTPTPAPPPAPAPQ